MLYDPTKRFDSQFYSQNARTVARKLIGCKLVVRRHDQWLAGWIVETEAYLDKRDPACHAVRGITRSNATMFGRGGLLYVYSIHAKYCMNVVTGAEGSGQAVLLRAIEPTDGQPQMMLHRGCLIDRDLARGPSRLCQALEIHRGWDGLDLTQHDDIWIEPPESAHRPRLKIRSSPRIGVTSAEDLELRFFVDGNRFVSGAQFYHQMPVTSQLSEPI